VGSEQFTQIQTRGLFQEFGFGRMRGVVVEGDEHRAGEVDDLSIEFENFGGSLDLGLETM